MKHSLLMLLGAGLLLQGNLAAESLEIGLSGLNTLRYGTGTILDETNQEVDREYTENILDVDLSWKDFRLNLAGAILEPAEFPDARPDSSRIEEVALLRRSLYWDGPVSVSLGHVWATFGDGLALDLYRDDALENPRLTGTARQETPTSWDSRVDGGLAEWYAGAASVKALYGTSDYFGTLGGLNVEYAHDLATLGGSYVTVDGVPVNIQDATPTEFGLDNYEIYLRTQVGPADVSLSHLDQHVDDEALANAGSGGLATYAMIGLPLGGWYLQSEYKYYRFARRALYFNNAPILQREIPTRLIARKRRQNFFEDEVGWQLDLSRYFDNGQELSFSAAVASHIDDALLPKFEESLSAYQEYTAGWAIELEHGNHLSFSAAYTEETRGFVEGDDPVANLPWFRRSGVGASLLRAYPLLGQTELSAEFMHKEELEQNETGSALLAWMDFVPHPAVSVNLTVDYEEHSEAHQDWMASTELRYDFSLPGQAQHSLTLFAGRLRGGLVCSSGNCRIVAPFNGAKLTLISQF